MDKVTVNHLCCCMRIRLLCILLSILIFVFVVEDVKAFGNYSATDLENCNRLTTDSNSSGGFVYGFNGKTLYSSMLLPNHYNRCINVPYNIKSACQSGELSCAMYICDNKTSRYGISVMNMNSGSTADYYFDGVNDASSKMFSLSDSYAYFVRSDAVYSYVAVYGINGGLKKKCNFKDNIYWLFNNNSITYAMLYDGRIYRFKGTDYTLVANIGRGMSAFNAGTGYICTESGMVVSLENGETSLVSDCIKNCVTVSNGGIYTANGNRLVFSTKNSYERFVELSGSIQCVVSCKGRIATLNYRFEYNDISDTELKSNNDSQIGDNKDNNSSNNDGNYKNNTQNIGGYFIENGKYIVVTKSSTSVTNFKKEFADSITIYDADGSIVSSGNVRTGYTVSADSRSYTIIVLGDLTGEGNVKSNDVNVLMNYCVDSDTLDELQMIAADYDCNGVVDNRDLVILARSIK